MISSTALFFSDGTSIRDILSRTERTRSCGVFGRFERLNKKAMFSRSRAVGTIGASKIQQCTEVAVAR